MLSFIRYGGAIGVTRLAANSLLMQLFTLFSYFMDGLAYAAEALVGEAIGGRKFGHLRLIIRITLQVASSSPSSRASSMPSSPAPSLRAPHRQARGA